MAIIFGLERFCVVSGGYNLIGGNELTALTLL